MRYVSYIRVSSQRQGQSGLGLEAQQATVKNMLQYGDSLDREFVEIESGKIDARPQLEKAIKLCRMTGATLIVAKLDRLSRDAAFLLNLSKSGIDIRCGDIPEANTTMFGMMAVFAQHEREMISKRTKDALAAAKARGKKLGGYRGGPVVDYRLGVEGAIAAANKFAAMVKPMALDLRKQGYSLHQIADRMARSGVKTARGGNWQACTVKRLLER